MSRVVGDPDEIESFRKHLHAYCQETREHLLRVCERLDRMEADGTWGDAVYHEYREQFRSSSQILQRTLDEMHDVQLPHLDHVVADLRTYLNE